MSKRLREIFIETTLLDDVIKEAVRKAVLRHKKLGNPIAVSRDGKVVWLQPEEILGIEKE